MIEAVPLSLFGICFLAIGAVILKYPDSMPDSGMVSPGAIKSDPEAAAAEARRWNQLRGFLVVAVGLAFLGAALVSLL